MNARFLLLPVLALFVGLSGCDAGNPTPDGLQTSPTVPTANVVTIEGPGDLGLTCTENYNTVSTEPGHFVIASGPGSLSNQTFLGNWYFTDLTRTGSGKITLNFIRDSDSQILGVKVVWGNAESCVP